VNTLVGKTVFDINIATKKELYDKHQDGANAQ
jgi:hypothetical protein